MFTGLIEEIGVVDSAVQYKGGKKIRVKANKVLEGVSIDDSIAINGCCQTVVSYASKTFEVVSIEETLRKSNLGELKKGDRVNLERAMVSGDRLGGHIVQGHVDCVGEVSRIFNEATSRQISIKFPNEFQNNVIDVGSICINGISLTVANTKDNELTVAVIPHTLSETNISELVIGDKVNLEFDMIGKYISKMVEPYLDKLGAKKESVFNQFRHSLD